MSLGEAAHDLYPGVAVQIPRKVLGDNLKHRGARFLAASRVSPSKAWVLVYPPCRTSGPFVKLVPVQAVQISSRVHEPPKLPEWAHTRQQVVL